ncbi:MAG: RnfABCDGE type electron transport complex subunit G, partial [Clostridium sp.]|nr:RnfABCDGE type electron transport complex subunit G [Clostridium sp.]
MKENLKLGGILLTITVIAGLLLGFANSLTAEAILENSKVSKEDLKVILPAASSIADTEGVETNETINEVYDALDGSGNKVGNV